MENSREIMEVYQDWLQGLPPEEQMYCHRAVKNISRRMRNIGEMNACEVLIAVLLFYRDVRRRQTHTLRLQAYQAALKLSALPAAQEGGRL